MAEHQSIPARIVIADDHPLFRSALRRLLEKSLDVEVVAEAADGREAVELCRRLRPDLVLMDLGMPNLNGIEASGAIKRELPTTIVLVLSAYEDSERLSEALKAGVAGYLLKTAPPQRITGAIRRALEGDSPLDQELAMELLLRLTDEKRAGQERAGAAPEASPQERQTPAIARELSPREVEVLRLLARGLTNQQIAKELLVSTSTVKNHVQRILAKLEVSDRTQAAIMANELGLISNL